MRVTATAGDDAYPDGLTVGQTMHTLIAEADNRGMLRTVPLDFRSGGVTGMLWDFEPWRTHDRSPLPQLVPFPRLERVASRVRKVTREAGRRCRNAWQSLRGEEWPDW